MSELSLQGSPIVAQLQVCCGITRCVQFQKRGRCAPSFVVLVSFFGRCITVGVGVFRNRSFGTSHCVSAIHIAILDNVQPKCYHVLSPVRLVALTQALSICTPKSKSEIF